MQNQHKYAQAFPLAAVLIGAAIAIIIVGSVVKALLVKHQVDSGGARIKKLEKELADITNKNDALQARKDQLTSIPELKKAMESGFLKLVKIADTAVVNAGYPRAAVVATPRPGIVLTSAQEGGN